jgi:hypothetical protein
MPLIVTKLCIYILHGGIYLSGNMAKPRRLGNLITPKAGFGEHSDLESDFTFPIFPSHLLLIDDWMVWMSLMNFIISRREEIKKKKKF